MSQDFKDAKKGTGSVFPEGTYDAAPGVNRVEPILTGQKMRIRFLAGVPMIYPVTKEKIGNEELEDYVERAKNYVEIDAQTSLSPTVRRVRLPFDPNLYHNNIWCEVPYKPVQKLLRLAICSASYTNTAQQNEQYPSGSEIYKIPNEWVDLSYAARGKIFVNPINPAFSAVGLSTSVAAGGGAILAFIGQQRWVPAYWSIEAVFGFCSENGDVPVIINELIGAKAAMLAIDNLILSYRVSSQSMGIDGLSQSVGDNMQNLLQVKRQYLDELYKSNIHKVKVLLGNTFFVSNV